MSLETRPEKEKTREKEPVEHSWELEKDKRYFTEIHHNNNGKVYESMAVEYTPGKYSSEIKATMYDDDVKVEVIPFRHQLYHHKVSLTLENGNVLEELFVGVKNEKTVDLIAIAWRDKNLPQYSKGSTYFFDNDGNPAGFANGYMSGPSWPLNRPCVINNDMYPYFHKLSKMLPDIAGSLRNTVAKLSKPGPQYKDNDSGLEFTL